MIWLYVGMVGFALAMLRGGAAIARASRERGFTRPVKQMTLALVLGAASLLLTPVLAAMEPSPVQKGLWVASDVLMRIAICALLLFVSETFGWLESRISVAWLVAVGLLLFATLAYDAASQPSLAYDPSTAGAMLSQLPIAAAFATVSGITLREWVRSRRRERLGIGHAATTRRYFFWSLGTFAIVAVCMLAIAASLALRSGSDSFFEWAQTGRGLWYGVASLCVFLALARAESSPAAAPLSESG